MLRRIVQTSSILMIFTCIVFAVGFFSPRTSAAGLIFGGHDGEDALSAGDDETNGEKESGEQSSLDAAMDLAETAREYRSEGDVEKALEALDQAYGLIAGTNCGNDHKLIQQKEDIRFLISREILNIYTSRHTGVKGSRKIIPLTMNKHVEREIERFKNEERLFFIDAYKRSGKFRENIVTALKKAGLPEELSWLPLVESGFKVATLSRGRGLGLWQFIPSTGYKFGLSRTDWIDERLDPEKSTTAAIAYLKELHSIFGDWAAVLLAYNCGEGAVLRVIRRQKIDYLDNFWNLYEKLPPETARYYPRFLAALAILRDPARYNMKLEQADAPPQFDVIPVQKQLHLKTIAEKLGVGFQELAGLNPELRYRVTPATQYSLKVPAGKGMIAAADINSLPAWTAPRKRYVYHRVRRGETLSLLALRYRTSVRAIASLNRIRRTHLLRVGQRLKIPRRRR